MPSQSTLSADDKSKVKSVIPVSPATNKIFYATLARIYYAHPSPSSWSYAGLQGALAFTRDNVSGACSFKLVDLNGTRGVIWEHELYQGLEYNADRGWFHSFAGDECMIGFVFSDEGEARDFWKKVLDKKDAKIKSKSKKSAKSPAKSSGKIDKSMISAPTTGSFKHLGHMGYDAEKGFTSKGVDPSWSAFLGQLESTGIDQETIAQNMDFIRDFVKTHPQQQQQQSPKKPKTKPPPPRARASVVPPPPPPPRSSIQRPSQPESEPPQPPAPPARPAGPPPPPARSSVVAPPPPPTRSSTVAPPPPPPARPSGPPVPPPPPARPSANSGPPPPPPPPPPPSGHSGPPPPPPPPPGGHSGGPPPPPPPPPPPGGPPPPPPPPPPTGGAPSGLPAPQPGRNDLLASIQGKGIHSLRKTEPSASPTSPSPGRSGTPAIEESSSSGGGDLTSALASALMARNAKMGEDSDEEEEDDDWD